MLYDCRDIGGFLEASLVWIHPIHQNLYRTQWSRVGNNVDSRDSRFVYGYVTLPLYASEQVEVNYRWLRDLNVCVNWPVL